MKKICLICKSQYEKSQRRSLKSWETSSFCSKSCSSKNRWLNDNGKQSIFMKDNKYGVGYKHTPEAIEKLRAIGKTAYRKKGHHLSDSHKEKIKLAHLGSNNWRWISDRTKLSKNDEFRNSAAHREWSRSVKNRDGWKCKIANSDCSGQVVAHHILSWREYVELRYEVNNGISLCHFHHPRKRNDEIRLSPYFQEMIKVK